MGATIYRPAIHLRAPGFHNTTQNRSRRRNARGIRRTVPCYTQKKLPILGTHRRWRVQCEILEQKVSKRVKRTVTEAKRLFRLESSREGGGGSTHPKNTTQNNTFPDHRPRINTVQSSPCTGKTTSDQESSASPLITVRRH